MPSDEQRRELAALETIFGECRQAWLYASAALHEIKAEKLYQAVGFTDWREYVRARWKIDSRRVEQAVALGEAMTGAPADAWLSAPEAVAGALYGFPPGIRQEIFETAQSTAPGGKLTAGWIEQTGRRLMEERLDRLNRATAEPEDSPISPPSPAADAIAAANRWIKMRQWRKRARACVQRGLELARSPQAWLGVREAA